MWMVLIVTSFAPLWPLIRKCRQALSVRLTRDSGSAEEAWRTPPQDQPLTRQLEAPIATTKATNRVQLPRLTDTNTPLVPEDSIYVLNEVSVRNEPRDQREPAVTI